MAFLRRRGAGGDLPAPERAAVAGVLDRITYELIPLKNVHDQAGFLPAGATVSVTASPAKGLEATVELAAALEQQGLTAIPHLSARMVRDRAHLRDLLARLDAAGIDRAFVVGGDAQDPGEFADGLSLLRAMAEIDGAPRHLGVPCYPEGHPAIPEDVLLRALHDKAPFVEYMATQMCFDPAPIARFIAARRAEGLAIGVKIGVPGVAEVTKLLSIGARIGVHDTGRFLSKNLGLVGALISSGGIYRPTSLLARLAPVLADPAAGVVGLHLYTFNQVEATERWRAELRAGLDTPESRVAEPRAG